MVNGPVLVPLHPRDFRLQVGDSLVELRHRQRIEILAGERGHRIVAFARKILVGIHDDKR